MTVNANEPIINQPFLYINGMIVQAATLTTLVVNAGVARDTTNTYDINLGNFLSNNPNLTPNVVTTLNFAVNGLNGLDTGAIAANKLYRLYVIADPAGFKPTGVIASLAAVPLMPFGYGIYRPIGYWATNGASQLLSAWTTGNDNMRTFFYDTPHATAVTAGNATVYTAIDLSAMVPPVDNTPIYVLADLLPGAAGRVLNLQPFSATGDMVTVTGQVAAVHITQQPRMMAKMNGALPEINYKVTNAGDAAAVSIVGFDYYL